MTHYLEASGQDLGMGPQKRGQQGRCLLGVGPEEGGTCRAGALFGAAGGNLLTGSMELSREKGQVGLWSQVGSMGPQNNSNTSSNGWHQLSTLKK